MDCHNFAKQYQFRPSTRPVPVRHLWGVVCWPSRWCTSSGSSQRRNLAMALKGLHHSNHSMVQVPSHMLLAIKDNVRGPQGPWICHSSHSPEHLWAYSWAYSWVLEHPQLHIAAQSCAVCPDMGPGQDRRRIGSKWVEHGQSVFGPRSKRPRILCENVKIVSSSAFRILYMCIMCHGVHAFDVPSIENCPLHPFAQNAS